MLELGLTGSIAAGKSTVSDYLRAQGLTVWDADQAARDVVEPGREALAKIVAAFGPEMLLPDGGLDRKRLGAAIFAEEEKRLLLNAITHPAVKEDFQAARERALAAGTAILVADIPLLFEGGMEEGLDLVCMVYCDDEVRKRRLMERDGLTGEEAALRMACQMPQEEKRRRADVVIDNSGSREDTIRQVDALLAQWRAMADDETANGKK